MQHHLVCIAGFPDDIVSEIGARSPARFTEEQQNAPIAFPLRPPFIYDVGVAEKYLRVLAGRLEKVPHRDYSSVILVAARHREDQLQRFVSAFFPFALVVLMPFIHLNTVEKHKRREALVEFVDSIEKRVDVARRTVRALWDQFGGNCYTPLLFPLGNFRSDVLVPKIWDVFMNIADAQDPLSVMRSAQEDLLGAHPPKTHKSGGARKGHRFFVDDRGLCFKSPGTSRHAFARISYKDPHLAPCFLSSRVRFGAHFDPLFHFDCSYMDRDVDRAYPNCHGALTAPGHADYVNIAPNDSIR